MSTGITTETIDACELLSKVGEAIDGAALLFLGTVRNSNEGRAVTGIRYEAYQEMAEPVLKEIVNEARARVADARIAAVHRIGELQVGDISVAIAVATPHRAEAFEAARYIIEEIKKRLPVWKHEAYVEGDAAWLEGEQPAVEGAAHE
jgi:molybdopterin synthase catalytic subunit